MRIEVGYGLEGTLPDVTASRIIRNVMTPQFKAGIERMFGSLNTMFFHGLPGTPQREYSVRQLVSRVVRTISEWGLKGGYFASEADAGLFSDELSYLLLNQYVSFNSPVWFNVGFEEKPQQPRVIEGTNQCYASMGVYIFDYEVLARELIRDAEESTTHDFGHWPAVWSKSSAASARASASGKAAGSARARAMASSASVGALPPSPAAP